jgi:5-methylcytosine-specific restriction endonuclease McrA
MNITPRKRPWDKRSTSQGTRYNPDPYYQSQSWKQTRESFRAAYTIVNNTRISNIYCIDCFKEQGILNEGKNTDHIVPRKEGGSDTHDNLQTQCNRHHAIKSAIEGNERRKNKGGVGS